MKSESPAWKRRQEIWRHNNFSDLARMMEIQCMNMLNARTCTNQTKAILTTLLLVIPHLKKSLKKRATP